MGSKSQRQPHVFFFPFMAHGHTIPMVDTAKLFASRGVKTTIITTPVNMPFLSKTIEGRKNAGIEIGVLSIRFPAVEVGLPEGCENVNLVATPEMFQKFIRATALLEQPFEQLLQEHQPDYVVADLFFPWATDVASKYGIPRLVFHVTCFFSMCVTKCMISYEPHKNVSSDSESFTLPNLPDEIKLTKSQVPDFFKGNVETEFTKMYKASNEADFRSYGVIVNSVYELEPSYADHYRNVIGRKAWHIGPVSLCNKENEDKAERGKQASIDEHECLKWLDSKKPNSVIYICFGSEANFNDSQLMEMALGLEASGQNFIWVVKRENNIEEYCQWLPEGFEKRIQDKGLIIRGWAPQVLILDHEAVGGFVTHCGWNSTLEAVTAGVPLVTWPLGAEQFFTEKLVTHVMKVGVGVGAKKWSRLMGDFIKREAIEKAVTRIIVGEEAKEMRRRAKELGETARRAVEEGGSSYNDLTRLIEELKALRS